MREHQRFQVALKAFVVDADRLLMVREAVGERFWELPGGRIEVGEESLSHVVVLRRELSEELGPAFAFEVESLVAVWVRPPDPPRRNVPVLLVGYRCRPGAGEIELSDEHVECRWVTRAESAQLELAPGYSAALDQFWAASDEGAARVVVPTEVIARYSRELEQHLGRRLQVYEDVSEGAGYSSVAARTVPTTPAGLVATELRLQILQATDDEGVPHVWALVFVFVAGERLRSPEGDYIGLSRDPAGTWTSDGWESDEYGEWAGTTLPALEPG